MATAEFAILDLLRKRTGKSIGDLLGGVRRREIAVYSASGNRGNLPEAVADLKRLVAETGARAIEFRVGVPVALLQPRLIRVFPVTLPSSVSPSSSRPSRVWR